MSKASSNLHQATDIVAGCIGKHKYATEEDAYQKGQTAYPCVYCGFYHRASIKKPMQQVRKNGVLNLDKPKKKKVVTPPIVNEQQQKIATLQTKNDGLQRELEQRTDVNRRYKAENHRLRRQYDRTIEGRLIKLYFRVRRIIQQRVSE